MITLLFIIAFAFSQETKPQLFSINITLTPQQRIKSLSMQSLLAANSIQKVRLLMGHLTHRYTNAPFPKNNIALIYSNKQPSSEIVSQIASIFGISQSQAYRLWQPQLGITTIADPNDKFCNEQFQHLLRLYLPCRNWVDAGLQQLYAIDKLTKGFLGMEFIWQPEQTTLSIVGQRQKKSVIDNYVRHTACGKVSFSEFYLQPQHSQILNSIYHERVSLSKWYHPDKAISFIIRQSTLSSQLNGSITMISRLSPGFKIKQFTIIPQNYQFKHQVILKADSSSLIFMEVSLPLKVQEIIISVSFQAKFPLIEEFQTIGGGGQELMGLTRVQIGDKRYELGTTQIAESLLQPDFSICFQTITSGLAVILTLWLTLWRSHQLLPSKSVLEDEDK